MVYVKRILLFALLGFLTWFVYLNRESLGQPVPLVFFKYTQTLMLGVWLLISFLAGALLFMVVDLPRSFSLKRELARKTQELARVQFELSRAQAQPTSVPGTPPQTAPDAPAIPPAWPDADDLEKRLEL